LNLRKGKLGFAIFHAITATELALKERLARLNPALVYRNIDTKTPHKEHTVALSALPQRLANLGLPLDSRHTQLIHDIAEWRHQIVHHTPEFNEEIAMRQLPQLLDFLAGLLRTDLGTPLETFLSKDLFKDAQDLLDDWQAAVEAARHEARSEGEVLPDSCPRCGSTLVMTLRNDDAVHCHLCDAALYRCDSCDGCGRRTVIDYAPFWGENYCNDCAEAAGERYAQHQSDLARGK